MRMHAILTLRVLMLQLGVALGLSACGQIKSGANTPDFAPTTPSWVKVDGSAGFGSQCPYGSISGVVAYPVELWNCPLGFEPLALSKPLPAIFLMADCKEKLISVRTADGSVDTLWEVAPDDTFGASLNINTIGLKSDRPQTLAPCRTSAKVELTGKLNCTDRDRVVVEVQSSWYLGPSTQAAVSGERVCQLPAGCELFSAAKIQQCR